MHHLLKMIRPALLLVAIFQYVAVSAQPAFTERADPRNPKKRLVELKPVVRRLPQTLNLRNILDEDQEKRPTLPHIPFETKNPRTGKTLNPDAEMKLKMPDGSERKTTVKEFFGQLNELEKKLNARGRSLRLPNTLSGLKRVPDMALYQQKPFASTGYSHGNFVIKPPTENKKSNTPGVMPQIGTGKAVTTNIGALTTINWAPLLYISESTSDHGTSEFPVVWAKNNLPNMGQKNFPMLVEAPNGLHNLVKKIVWQVSTAPFDQTLVLINVPGVVKSGTVDPVNWSNAVRGTDMLPKQKNSRYAPFSINMADVPYPPADNPSKYYVRAICYDQDGEVLKLCPQVLLVYGGIIPELAFEGTERNSVPNFEYAYPKSNDIPFGVYVRGTGLNTNRNYVNYIKQKKTVYTDFNIKANAALGIRYFNFLNLVNSSEPKSKELEVLKIDFNANAAANKSLSASAGITISGLNGLIPTIAYDFKAKTPSLDDISLDYTFSQKLDVDLLNTRFMIGPVPIKITAAISGDAGITMSGYFSPTKLTGQGEIKPYIHTSFLASGGVDAVIAYATLFAEVNPLLNLDLPLRFSSSYEKPIELQTSITGLQGRVYLKAGFFYPCPSLEKIAGWISGDEELPLCECAWEFNIFDFPSLFQYNNIYPKE